MRLILYIINKFPANCSTDVSIRYDSGSIRGGHKIIRNNSQLINSLYADSGGTFDALRNQHVRLSASMSVVNWDASTNTVWHSFLRESVCLHTRLYATSLILVNLIKKYYLILSIKLLYVYGSLVIDVYKYDWLQFVVLT